MSTNHTRSFRLVVLIAIFCFGLALAQTTALAQTASFSRTDLPSLGNNHIAVDVNGDAVLDLVGTGLNSVGVMLGNGNGTFRPKVEFRTGGRVMLTVLQNARCASKRRARAAVRRCKRS